MSDKKSSQKKEEPKVTKKYSDAGKGDKRRGSQSKYAENWEKIFGAERNKKNEK